MSLEASLNVIIEHVGQSRFAEASDAARSGSVAGSPLLHVVMDVADLIWSPDRPCAEALQVNAMAFAACPAYWLAASASARFDDFDEPERAAFWAWVESQLASGEPFRTPVETMVSTDFVGDMQSLRFVPKSVRSLMGLGDPNERP